MSIDAVASMSDVVAAFGQPDYQKILDAIPAAIYATDADGIVTFYNRAAEEIAGRTPRVGIDYWCVTHRLYRADGSFLPHDQCPMAVAIRERRPVRNVEVVAERPDGRRVPAMPFPTPIFDEDGAFVGAVNMLVDISALKAAETSAGRRADEQAALYQFTDRLFRAGSLDDVYAAALDAIVGGLKCDRASILLFDAEGVMRFAASRGLSETYRQAVDGHSPWRPGDTDPTPIFVEDILVSSQPDALKRIVAIEGISALGFIPLVANGALIGKFMTYYDRPHDFTDGEVALAVTIARQLGFSIERRQSEAERDLLLAELSHRVKNTLATVISIAHQSFANEPGFVDARKRFESRIRALSQTHTRLAESSWSSVSLETLLRDELAPYRLDDGRNIDVSGPAIALTPRQAIVLGMGFHELATNAAKYGALTSTEGVVAVRWQVEDKALRITWAESDGPPATAPLRQGFGRILLERVLAADLKGKVSMDFAPGGLVSTIGFPLDPEADA